MSSMCRSIRRSRARKNGSFVAQKPLRDRNQMSFKDMLLNSIRLRKKEKKVEEAN